MQPVMVLAVFLAILFFRFWLSAPSFSHAENLPQGYYAHRGLHSSDPPAPENSLSAFRNALRSGYGIELDVQCTSDGVPVVFHDSTLLRQCGIERKVAGLTISELSEYSLPDGSPIPQLRDILELVNGRVPLMIELKRDGGAVKTASEVLTVLRSYPGEYSVVSFDPFALRVFRRNMPSVPRGQLVYSDRSQKNIKSSAARFVSSHFLLNAVSRPHFLSCNAEVLDTSLMRFLHACFSFRIAVWTLCSAEETEKVCKAGAAVFLFERFLPNA